MDERIQSSKSPKGARFRRYFPVAAFLVGNIWKLLPAFLIVGLILGTFSVHYGLSVMCVWLGLLCFWVDRKHLDYCLFTPLQPLAVVLIMGLGAGISMVTIDSEKKYQYGFLCMQLVGLLGIPFMIYGYMLVMRKVPAFVFPSAGSKRTEPLTKPLVLVGWIFTLLDLGKVVAGIVSGVSDRGYAGDFQVETPFGWWSAFSIFLRIQTMGYVLVPLIWRESRTMGRVLVAAIMGAILFLNFVGGSRGAVIYPLFILLVGCYMFLEPRRMKYELILLIGMIALAPLVTLMANYRSSAAFRETDIRDVFKKLSTLKEGLALQKEMAEKSGEHYSESGRAFIGVADDLVYEMTPNDVPYEGFGRLQDALWAFVPYILVRENRPVLQDGYTIVVGYTGFRGDRTSIGISLPAELYRRWSWPGVPIGLLLYGLFYGAVFRFTYRLYLFRNALLGFLISGLFFHFFIAWFFHSVLTMIWYWTYDIPKHLALIGVLYLVAKQASKAKKIPGARKLMRTGNAPTSGKEPEATDAGDNPPGQLDNVVSLPEPAP